MLAVGDVHCPRYLPEFIQSLEQFSAPEVFLFAGDMINRGKAEEYVTVLDVIEELEKKMGKLIPMEEVTKALEGKMKESEIDEIVGKLLKSGDLFRPRRGFVQKM